MRHFIIILSCFILLTYCGIGQELKPQQQTPAKDVLQKWRTAIHTQSLSKIQEAETITTSNQDGMQATLLESFTMNGNFHRTTNREFDTTEVTLTNTTTINKDWNGFLRNLKGKELSRLRSEVFERLVTLFGPPEAVPETTMAVAEADSAYRITLVPEGGEPTQWLIDNKTWLPKLSTKPGEEDPIVTTYLDWRENNGVLIPFSANVVEPEKPDYSWQRVSVKFQETTTDEHFLPPVAGASDTYMDSTETPIPFNFENNHIIFPLTINGRDSVLFLLDTGANEEAINESRLADYQLKPYGKTLTSGGGGTADYSYACCASFHLPGVDIRNQHVAIIDETGLERALGLKLGGLLGYDFISRFVIEIDYQKQTLILHNPKTWNYHGTGYIVPVVFDIGIPFANASISVPTKPSIPAYMVLDFGAAETMTLTSPFVKENDILNLAATNVTVNKLTGLENQFFAQNNVRGHIDRLQLGNLSVSSFPANLSVNTKGAYASKNFSGTIGEGIYHRYRVFLDYQKKRVIFEPTEETDKPYPERMTYGLTILASGADLHTFTVTAVRANSPAEKDGFKKGDVISTLDGKSSSRFTLGGLRDSLSHEDVHRELTVIREGKESKMSITVHLVSLDKK